MSCTLSSDPQESDNVIQLFIDPADMIKDFAESSFLLVCPQDNRCSQSQSIRWCKSSLCLHSDVLLDKSAPGDVLVLRSADVILHWDVDHFLCWVKLWWQKSNSSPSLIFDATQLLPYILSLQKYLVQSQISVWTHCDHSYFLSFLPSPKCIRSLNRITKSNQDFFFPYKEETGVSLSKTLHLSPFTEANHLSLSYRNLKRPFWKTTWFVQLQHQEDANYCLYNSWAHVAHTLLLHVPWAALQLFTARTGTATVCTSLFMQLSNQS